MPEILLVEAAPGEATSKSDPRTRLLALLALNALVVRASPTPTLLAVQLLAVVALAQEVDGRAAVCTELRCLVCDICSLGSPFLVAWLESVGSSCSLILLIGACSAIAFRFTRFSAGFDLVSYMYRMTRIGQMEAALRAVRLLRILVDAPTVALRVIPTVDSEAVAIREAMEMRGVNLGVRGVLHHPLAIIKHLLVLLLSPIARMANDLAASSIIRGLGSPTRPTSLARLRVTVWDALTLVRITGVVAIEVDVHLGVLP